jgi:hypothetical protein
MADISVQSYSAQSLMKTTDPAAKKRIDRKFTTATHGIHSNNTNTELVELLTRLSELVDGFVRLSHASHFPIGKPENPNQWNIFECANAILSIATAHGGTRLQRSTNNYPICCCKNSRQTTLTGPCAICIGVRSSPITKSYCSEAGSW